MEHKWAECNCEDSTCMFCAGGLALCTVCGGFEGTLTKDCCGYKPDEFVLDAVYKGGLDFVDGQWIVYETKCLNCYGYNVPDYCEESPLDDKICHKFKLWKK